MTQNSAHGAQAGSPHSGLILVATDLSDLDRLMPVARRQAAATEARIILLHVMPAGASMGIDAMGMPFYDPSAALALSSSAMEPWCAEVREAGISCKPMVHEGNPAEQIVAAAGRFAADCLLMGTHGRSRLGKLLIGSVAEQVLRSVDIPVITVGPEAGLQDQEEAEAERVVLHAAALREGCLPSAELARGIAAAENARLVLLHVLPPVEVMRRQGMATGDDSEAMGELRALAARAGADCNGSCVEPVVAHGNPAIEILAMASERRVALIVLGATRRSAFENLTHERTIYRVLAHARCPVVTLREPQAESSRLPTEQAALHF